jgi:hypothetical protein
MIINSDTSGLEALQLRLQEMRMLIPGILTDTAQIAGDTVASALGDAAPVGKGEGGSGNPHGDAPGPLSESFSAEASASGNVITAEVTCDQPTKLDYVVHGTGIYAGKGRIVPTRAKALYWEGADHPYRSVAGQRPNDFVSPVLETVDEIVEPEIQDAVDVLSGILEGS